MSHHELIAGDVAAIVVTRGDVDLTEIRESLIFPEVFVWNNADNEWEFGDLGAYGRYEAIKYVEAPVIYFQDDDCVVKPEDQQRLVDAYEPGVLTALMPPERTDYTDTVLIGWGSIFDRALPIAAFTRWHEAGHRTDTREFMVVGADFVFPILTPNKRLDAYPRHLPWAYRATRTWASWPHYGTVKEWYLNEGRAIRDRPSHG